MSETAPHPDSGQWPAGRSLAARDAAGVMLGLAALLEHRSFDEGDVDPRLVETTVRRLRRVGGELLAADEDVRTDDLPAPPDGIAWATQLSWLLSRSRRSGAVSGLIAPEGD